MDNSLANSGVVHLAKFQVIMCWPLLPFTSPAFLHSLSNSKDGLDHATYAHCRSTEDKTEKKKCNAPFCLVVPFETHS